MKDHEIIELYWARNESAITATTEKYGNYCHTIAYTAIRLHITYCVTKRMRRNVPTTHISAHGIRSRRSVRAVCRST